MNLKPYKVTPRYSTGGTYYEVNYDGSPLTHNVETAAQIEDALNEAFQRGIKIGLKATDDPFNVV